ncbi:hypothetical protein [Thiomonas sp. X19]|uniref:hypothetical protein n=1 Tax=Thiomonas sp. X19 TaxID=1050370 RepID=UPI0011BEEDEF|nr:hypothetical protein [Thiomonas sp. X19]
MAITENDVVALLDTLFDGMSVSIERQRRKNKAALGGLLNRIEISQESDLPGLCCQIEPYCRLEAGVP